MNKDEIFICHYSEDDTARIVNLELRYRGYDVCREYSRDKRGISDDEMSAVKTCRYVLVLVSDRLFESEAVKAVMRIAIGLGKEIVPICPSGLSRGLPTNMPSELDCLKTIQVSVLQTDDLFEKSVDKIIEDRFAEDFKKGRKGRSITANGLSLNTLRLIDIVRADDESLDACIYRVFSHKIDEAHQRDWEVL